MDINIIDINIFITNKADGTKYTLSEFVDNTKYRENGQ